MPLLTTAAANPSDSPANRSDVQLRAAPKPLLIAALWLIAIAVAFALDRPLAYWLRDSGVAQSIKFGGYPKNAAKFAGYFWFSLAVAIPLLIWHPLRWRAAFFTLLCALVGGTNSILKWMVGRSRPFKLPPLDLAQPFRCSPFNGGLSGLFHQSNDLSFVSGHAALAFATATGVAILFHKTRRIVYLVYTIAIIVLLERVGENAHWLSDAVCGAALGVWGVALLAKCCRGLLLPGSS
jgi:membrane-associated phospholipid phosphatase